MSLCARLGCSTHATQPTTTRIPSPTHSPLLVMHFRGQRLAATVNGAFASKFLSGAEIEAEREGHCMVLEYVLAKLVLPEVGTGVVGALFVCVCVCVGGEGGVGSVDQ